MFHVSVIVPIHHPTIKKIGEIYNFFQNFNNIELIFVSPNGFININKNDYKNTKFFCSNNSRAHALNTGIENSTGENLLFFHCDTAVCQNTLKFIFKNCDKKYLYYSKLKFYGKSKFCIFNQFFANIRSKILGCPFGDQMFYINKQLFIKNIGKFNTNEKYGEDHVLTWQCKNNNIPIVCSEKFIKTSSVKYDDYQWLKTTILHQYMFWKQYFKYLYLHIKYRFYNKIVISCFCKNPIPGYVKTRIAKTHGNDFAANVYKLFIQCISEVLESTKIDHIFAIDDTINQNIIFNNKKTMNSGNGGLGARLAYVMQTLKIKYQIVCIIGSDIPTIDKNTFKNLVNLHKKFEVIIGPSPDGGFYLISSNIFIPNHIFENIEYSKNTTLKQLLNTLDLNHISYFLINEKEDIDTIEELKNIKKMVSKDTIKNKYLNEIIKISEKL